ncbi:MAG TPA: outer membrane lipoprotein-sorting protein, partial [Myxococcota bacterium]|nr:outer membrane lipoprotein-sorting protein [Myxococcota bacterium]
DADQWSTRVADALRVGASLSGRARVRVERPGDRALEFSFDVLRQPWRAGTRTVFEMQESGDPQSVVSELVVEPGQPMVNWYWDLQKRRWLAVRGLLATDPWSDSTFRHEDLWLTDPVERRRGEVRELEEDGRRWVELHSEPYHYYGRVETRIDPATALPVRIRFIDVTGAPIREQVFESVETVGGRPFPKVVRLRDLQTGAESVLTWERVEFDRKIPPSFLDLSVLHDRITKGVDPVPLDALPEPRAPDQI